MSRRITLTDGADGSLLLHIQGDKIAGRFNDALLLPDTVAALREHFEHKPWHDAKPGEIWVLEIAGTGSPRAWQITDRRSHFWALGVGYHAVTARDILSGRRIWPEDAS
ncbi:MAG TPA: hypothetical protein VN133_13720 [Humibacter sp.]|nr:hypothetical protein [Humibacter sp.]